MCGVRSEASGRRESRSWSAFLAEVQIGPTAAQQGRTESWPELSPNRCCVITVLKPLSKC